MAGEAGYPWTVMQKTRIEDTADEVGPWIVAWCWRLPEPVLVLSERLLRMFAETPMGGDKATGLYMSAQQEDPHLFKNKASAFRIRDEVLRRARSHGMWGPAFVCKTVTKPELDKWKIERELEQIAFESGSGVSA